MDVGVGRSVERFLAAEGFDVKSIISFLPGMEDIDILDMAEKENRIVVTMDKDFGELIFHNLNPHTGVLLLRLGHSSGNEKAEIVKYIINEHANELAGHFSVFQNGKLRIKK